MKVLKKHIFLAEMFVIAILMATTSIYAKSAPSSKKADTPTRTIRTIKRVEGSAKMEKQRSIYEHAAANRELAALTQIERAKNLEEKATAAIHTKDATEQSDSKSAHSSAGSLEKAAAVLYGQAAANFDKAAANHTKIAAISQKLGKVEEHRKSQVYAANLKTQGNDAMQMAADACEAAAVAYDKAGDLEEVAINSQMAATWLEKLAVR